MTPALPTLSEVNLFSLYVLVLAFAEAKGSAACTTCMTTAAKDYRMDRTGQLPCATVVLEQRQIKATMLVQVLLLESAVPTLEFASQVAQKGKGKRKRGDPNQKWIIHDAEMDFMFNWLLMTNETSLAIGPDSDGLLNFCDSSSSSAATGSAADATGSAKSAAASGTVLLLAPWKSHLAVL